MDWIVQENLLPSTKAILVIAQLGIQASYQLQNYRVPGISAGLPETPNPLNRLKWTPDHLSYEDLDVSFLVEDDLANWIRMHNWLRFNASPITKAEFAAAPFNYSDMSIIILSNKRNPVVEVKVRQAQPSFLSGIDFSVTDTDTIVKTANVTFAIQDYDIVKL